MSPRVNPGSNVSSEPSSSKLNMKGYPVLMSPGTFSGYKVMSDKGEEIGKVEDVLLDVTSGTISCVLASFGGLLGLGSKLIAIPWKSLSVDSEKQLLTLHIHKDRLLKAPGIEKGSLPQVHDKDWVKGVYSFFGQVPDWKD